MNDGENLDLLSSFTQLLAANNSLESRLEEYAVIIRKRDQEIDMLQSMLSEANEYKSSTDNQVLQLKALQEYLGGVQQQVTGIAPISNNRNQVGDTVGIEGQLENLKQAYASLQTKLVSLQMQLQEMSNRNLLLQQQTGRIAELESRLANLQPENEEPQ